MTDFLRQLPSPVQTVTEGSFRLISPSSIARKSQSEIPTYGSRQRWVPKCLGDFGDGGSFPEIHVAQFPMDMGRRADNAVGSRTVALQVDEAGVARYDAVVLQEGSTYFSTRPEGQRPKWSSIEELQKPTEEEETIAVHRTRQKLAAKLEAKLSGDVLSKISAEQGNSKPEFIKYTPNQQAVGHNANCEQRIIRLVEKKIDPLEPPKFRNRRVPAGPPEPPPTVQHTPPKKLTQQDQLNWKIPPCVSNWKNQKGYTIPLDKRLAADGRNLQSYTINDKFAAFSESLYIAERSAREEIRIRNDLLKQKRQKEEEGRELQLREIAINARQERSAVWDEKSKNLTSQEMAEDKRQQRIEEMRKRELEREFRLEKAGKKSKRMRDDDRDISERVVLGQAQPTSQEGLFDTRIFNQNAGLDSGFGEAVD